MATVASMQPPVSSTDPTWIPSPLYRMSLEQYEAMIASGAFTTRGRVQLKDGLRGHVLQSQWSAEGNSRGSLFPS
jgi:hypothetical protein